MSEIKVERKERPDEAYVLLSALDGKVRAYVYPQGLTYMHTPKLMANGIAEARAFAQAIIAVADAVEREGKE